MGTGAAVVGEVVASDEVSTFDGSVVDLGRLGGWVADWCVVGGR